MDQERSVTEQEVRLNLINFYNSLILMCKGLRKMKKYRDIGPLGHGVRKVILLPVNIW
jgi:hypothetical protein